MARLPEIVELNIGHFLIGEAIFGGLTSAIHRMRALMDAARADRPRRATPHRPMILGLGNDIIDIRRIEKTIERYGERFLVRVFTDTERQKSDGRAARAASYAKRFAAKEACAKALGTGLRRGVFWRDMGVVNLRSGRPTMVLTGGAAEQLRLITPPGYAARVDLTLTDDFPRPRQSLSSRPYRKDLRPDSARKRDIG